MKFCSVEYEDDLTISCGDHNLPLDHCAPDGDSAVCAHYAKEYGCNCCPENYNKADIPKIPIVKYHFNDWEGEQEREILGEVAGEIVVSGNSVRVVFKLDSDSNLRELFKHTMLEKGYSDRILVEIEPQKVEED